MKKSLVAVASGILVWLTFLLSGCTGAPEGIEPVKNFELDRYLGKWYEIARLDHSFERGLSRVTAEYTMRSDGGVKVINRGYSIKKEKWKEAEGKAYFVGAADTGHLKVSFFGPFYGAYVIYELDQENYQHALVSGPNRSYLWILARSPSLEQQIQDKLIAKAAALGFDTSKLIYVEHQ